MDFVNKVIWNKYLKEVRELVMQIFVRRVFQVVGKLVNIRFWEYFWNSVEVSVIGMNSVGEIIGKKVRERIEDRLCKIL